MTAASGAVEVDAVEYAYPGGGPVLSGIDLSIQSGERVAVLGPNGAGKTTLVLHLNGILSPDAGRVRIGGLEVSRRSLREVRRRVGVVFQDPDDQLFMPTVGADVAFGPSNLGVTGDDLAERVRSALTAVGMAAAVGEAPHRLSLGQRRRVAVATVLAMGPEVLVLDEPTANLDPRARRELSGVLASLAVTTVVVTHDLPYALELCERAVILDGGRIVADGPTPALLADGDLLAAHDLELPPGFDPRSVRTGRRSAP